MSNKIILFCFIAIASLLFACGSENVEKDVKATFVGTIQEINGDSAIIDAAEEDGKMLGQISINLAVNPNETFQIGDRVRVGYDGMIMESAPAQIKTLSVEKVE
ncbi:hypothetical protein JOD29_003318 [Lysinibacillus composti]|uniref:DUF3221 domain-containing protein n=1 Tax=Lysinibacillus composti TaxID=720633 RepID=A0A3N9UA01_9BACI|nr:DUF3221 domain-containing protein [Lysinibacillus composti]MBM7610040.1 hypothetical protein [Lysinibacillus composti]RQW73301.1 hypothetical protein EBB45_17265 [Lysinibacillus composti]